MSSLEIVDSKERITSDEADIRYKYMQYLMKDIEIEHGVVHGIIYALSKDPATYKDLIDLENKLQEQGVETMIDGDYYPSLFDSVEIVG